MTGYFNDTFRVEIARGPRPAGVVSFYNRDTASATFTFEIEDAWEYKAVGVKILETGDDADVAFPALAEGERLTGVLAAAVTANQPTWSV